MMTEATFDDGNHSTDYAASEESGNSTWTPEFRQAFSVMFYRYMFIVIYSLIFVVCIVGK